METLDWLHITSRRWPDPGRWSSAGRSRCGKSLLAVGITEVVGDFEQGAVVGLKSGDGIEFARGLANYSSEELKNIRGRRKDQLPRGEHGQYG